MSYVPKYGNKTEHAIVRLLVKELGKAGYVPVTVWNSEDYVPVLQAYEAGQQVSKPAPLTPKQYMDAIFDVDASVTLHFAPECDLENWGTHGIVLVQGNGEDLISNWHCGDERFNTAIEAVVDIIKKGPVSYG